MLNFKKSNSGKIRVKLLATLLVLTLTFANFALVRFIHRWSNSSRNWFIKSNNRNTKWKC